MSWTASTGVAPTGYYVVRTNGEVNEAACGTSPDVTITGASCTDDAVAIGTYTYRVVAVHQSWTASSAPSSAVAVTIPDSVFLGAASSFSVLGTTATNVGVSTVSGDVGVSPTGAVIDFPPGSIGGDIHLNDTASAAAASAGLAAYDDAKGRTPNSVTPFPGDPIGMTFTPGVHHTAGAMTFTGNLTLDAQNDPNAIFIFQVNGALTTAANSHVLLVNGAKASNVFWQVNGASGHGADSTFSGSILALGAINLGANAELIGRALSQAAVSLEGNVIRFTTELSPAVTITGGAAVATKVTTPVISGTTSAVPGRPVTVTVGGQTLTTTVQGDGTWSVNAAALAAGTYTVTTKIRDAAGNGGFASQQLTIEVNPPTIVLGAAAPYSVLTEANVVGTGTSTLAGELGVTPGTSVTGFGPGTSGTQHLGDAAAATAWTAAEAAFADGSARIPHTSIGVFSGSTFHTGVHRSSTAVVHTGSITLDAENDPDAVFIFQINGALTTAAASSIVLVNGAQASNVFWIVQEAVDTGANSTFAGTILTPAAVTLGNLTALDGRVLAGGAVTLANNTIALTPPIVGP